MDTTNYKLIFCPFIIVHYLLSLLVGSNHNTHNSLCLLTIPIFFWFLLRSSNNICSKYSAKDSTMIASLLLPSSSLLLSRGTIRLYNYGSFNQHKTRVKGFKVKALKEKTEEIKSPTSSQSSSVEEVTKKFGLEAGLWKIFNSKDEGNDDSEQQKSKGNQAKELLAKYGGAYLATSITLSLISFALCYALINAGVDVQALLQKVGITTNETSEKVGTFALAYAAHKAASPIRFPPTVALTPIVAGWIGKKAEKD